MVAGVKNQRTLGFFNMSIKAGSSST